MTINVTYFDTRTGSIIKHHRNKDQELQRRIIGDSLLQFFYGNQEFYTGKLDKYTTAQELQTNKIPGTDLLLSSKGATYYFQDSAKITDQIFPDITHRAAYGSILIGGCQNSSTGYNRPLQILIVDDLTGDSGGYLSLQSGRQLTGDCHGKVAIPFAEKVFQTAKTVTQFRFGINRDPILGTWIAKGVLSPIDMNFEDIQWQTADRPDVILPISSFKGKKQGIKELPQPGLYAIAPDKFWIGQKGVSKLTQVAMSQLVSSYPAALPDILPVIYREAKRLSIKQRDMVSLAELYCLNHEEREISLLENAEEDFEQRTDPHVYTVVRAALDKGNYAWLKIPAVVDDLEKFVAGEWRDLAIGRSKALAWEGAVIVPSKDLRNGEICVPWLPDQEPLLYYRSPFINSNGACLGINRKDIWELNPASGTNIQNVIYISDRSLEQILAEQAAAQTLYDALLTEYQDRAGIIAAAPARLPEFDQALDDLQYFEKLTAPYESIDQFKALYQPDAERMQADYDGDNIAVVPAARFPNLAAEIEKKLLPANLLPAIEKLAKESFAPDMTLEDAVVFMAGAYVQLINASGTNLIATRSEVELLKEHGSNSDKYNFLMKVKLNAWNFSDSLTTGIDSTSLVTGEPYQRHTSPEFDRAYAPFLADPFLTDLESLQQLAIGANKKRFVQYLGKSIDQLLEANRDGALGILDEAGNLTTINLPPDLLQLATDLRKRLKNNSFAANETIAAYAQLSDRFIAADGKQSWSHPLPVVGRGIPIDLDRALDRYAAAVAVGIGAIGQQNQIAVDIFKSARLPDEGLVDGIKGALGNRVKILADKRKESELYKQGKVLEANNYSPLDIMASLVNTFYIDNRVGDSTVAGSFKEYFESIPVPEEYRAFAQYYRGKYNDLQQKTNAAQEIEAIEDNLVLVLADGDYRFEVTNIDRRLYTAALKDRDCTVSILPSGEGNHRFEVLISEGDGLRKLGVISKKSEAVNAEILEPLEHFFAAGSAQLEPVNLISSDLKAETNDLLAEFSQKIDDRGFDRRTMVATLGQALSSGSSKLNFLVRAMPQDFGFFIRSDGGLNMKFPKSQLLENYSYLLTDSTLQEFQVSEAVASQSKTLSLLGSNGELTVVANLDPQTMLVPGVEYVGTLAGRAPTLDIAANIQGVERTFRVGKLENYDFKTILTDEDLEFRFQKKHEESYNAFIEVDGERVLLGRIEQSKMVFDLLKGDRSSQILAEEVNEFNGLAAIELNLGGETVYLSVATSGRAKSEWRYRSLQNIPVDIVMDTNRSLVPTLIVEAKIDGQFMAIGEVTKKDDFRVLQSLPDGLLTGKATSKVSMVDFIVARATKSFNWEVPAINLSTVQNPLREAMIHKIGFNPSILAEGNMPWLMPSGQIAQLPTISMALSSPVAATAIRWLQSKGIEPLVIPPDHPEVSLETQRGYRVIRIPTEDLPTALQSSLHKRFGQPVSTNIVTDNLAIEVLLSQSSPVSPYEAELLTQKVIEPTLPTVLKDLKSWLAENGEDLTAVELPSPKAVPPEFKSMALDIDQNFQGKLQKAGDYLVASFASRGLRDNAVRNLGFSGLQETLAGNYAAVALASDVDNYLDRRVVQYFDRDPQNPFHEVAPTIDNPLSTLLAGGKASSKQHRDMLMAGEANQFIGRSVIPGQSFVDQYAKAWGKDANPRQFNSNTVVMVSGDIKTIDPEVTDRVFQDHYIPLLAQAAQAGAKIVVGNSPGVDRLTQKHLKSLGYRFNKENGYYVGQIPPLPLAAEIPQTVELSVTSRTPQMTAGKVLAAQDDPYHQKPARNPLADILQDKTLAFQKDLAMSDRANKFIGIFLSDVSLRATYRHHWGERSNLTAYSADDVVMVVGDGIGPKASRDAIAKHFEENYQPLLSAAVAAGATVVTGDGRGVDKHVQNYLIDRGYRLEFSHGFVSAAAKPKVVSLNTNNFPKVSAPVMFRVDSNNNFVAAFMRGCINEYKQLNPDLSSTERFVAGIQATVSKKAVRSKIAEFGGLDWLQSCSFASKVSPQMSGKSLDSGFIRIVMAAYESKGISAAVDLRQSSPEPDPIAVVEPGTMIQSPLPPESEIKFSVPVSKASLNNRISPEIAPIIDTPKPKISLDDLVPLKAKFTVDRAAVTLQILDTLRSQSSRDYEERNFRYLLRNGDGGTPVLEVMEDDRVVFSSEATGYDDRGEVIWETSVFELKENFFDRTEGMASEVLRPTGVNGDSLKETLRERANSVSR
jgi:hypothetical protein